MKSTVFLLSLSLWAIGSAAAQGPAAAALQDSPSRPCDPKKGFAMTTGRDNRDVWKARIAALHVSWHYSWGAQLPGAEPPGVQFVPMIWGYWGAGPNFLKGIDELSAEASAGTAKCLLGFNEPDHKDQANLPVARALEGWPYLMKTGLRLGSPAPAQPDGPWMQAFMAGAKAKGYRIDFVCIHSYGGPNVAALVNRLRKIHTLYGKPLWITEFAVADWKAKSPQENRYSPAVVLRFMKAVLPALDKLDFVERYAWFSGSPDSGPLASSALFKKDGTLTELGRFYASYPSAVAPATGTEGHAPARRQSPPDSGQTR